MNPGSRHKMENTSPKTPTPLSEISITDDDLMKIQKNRRSITATCYGNELIRDDCSTSKQANFVTDCPLAWYHAVQRYIFDGKIINRCELKRRKVKKVDKISILKIRMAFNVSQEINLSINFNTGVICIKGAACRHWIDSDFSKLKSFVNDTTSLATPEQLDGIECENNQSDDTTNTIAGIEQNSELAACTQQDRVDIPSSSSLDVSQAMAPESSHLSYSSVTQRETLSDTTCLPDKGENQSKKEQSEKEKKEELDELWKGIESLKTALSSLDQSLISISKRVDESVNESTYGISQVERKFDAKVALFFETTEKNFLKKYENMEKNFKQ